MSIHGNEPAAVGPVTAKERIGTLDVLRGLALSGVLIANVWMFFNGAYLHFAEVRQSLRQLSLDTVVFLGIAAFISSKAMTTFGFLFGVGFGVQLDRSAQKGSAFVPMYSRRLAALYAIGLLHATLIWMGDILALYACGGVVLLLMRRTRDRTLLTFAGVLFIASPLIIAIWPSLLGAHAVPHAAGQPHPPSLLERIQQGGYLDWVSAHLEILQSRARPWLIGLAQSIGVFCVGLWVVRHRWHREAAAHPVALRRIAIYGLSAGLPVSMILAVVDYALPHRPTARWFPIVTAAGHVFSTLTVTAGYIAVIVLLLQRASWRRVLEWFAPVGRMALSNYLAQSVICVSIFYGGRLFGRVGATSSLAICVAIFAVQVVVSRLWLTRFQFGPAEWLWRSVTYGRAQPMRIGSAGSVEAAQRQA